MIDLHNHVLPGMDDGPGTQDMSLRMLEIAAAQGITHVACTSHVHDRCGAETEEASAERFSVLQEAVGKRGIPVRLALASEIMVGADLLKLLQYKFASYHGAGLYALIEFQTETPFEIIQNVVKALRRRGLWPVLAHYERFHRAMRESSQPLALRKEGAVLTMDAGSLTGQFGSVVQKRARQLLDWDCIDILASDAHDDATHGFCLKAGRDAAADIIGSRRAAQLVWDNPLKVWDGVEWISNQAQMQVDRK